MKVAMLFILGSFSFSPPIINQKTLEPRTYYYFCISEEAKQLGIQSKRQVIYTDINNLLGEESDVNTITQTYIAYAKQWCPSENKRMCYNFRYYENSYEKAERKRDSLLIKYENSGKFDIKHTNFKFN